MLSQTLRGTEPLLPVLVQRELGWCCTQWPRFWLFPTCVSQHASLVTPSVIVPGQEGVQICVGHTSKDGGCSPVCEGDFPDPCVENECVE